MNLFNMDAIWWFPPLLLFQGCTPFKVWMSTSLCSVMVSLKSSISMFILLIPPLFFSREVIMLKSPPTTHKSSGYKLLIFTRFCRKALLSLGIWGPYTPVSNTQSLDPMTLNLAERICGMLTQYLNHISPGFQIMANPHALPFALCPMTWYWGLWFSIISFSFFLSFPVGS